MSDDEVKNEEGRPARADGEVSDARASAAGEGSAEDAAAKTESAETAAPVRSRSRGSRQYSVGIAHIKATFNNTQVCITDPKGAVISWSSAGRAGFKGSRKSTAFAATMVGQEAARAAVAKGMYEVEVHIQGPGSGRESAIRALQSSGLNVTVIRDVTPMPHNGCRPRKKRRV
jgi:small subunit ribosomal protein S11